MLQGWDLNSRDTRDMKNNMEARTYAHIHIVLAKVQYEENRPAHLVLHARDKQLKSAPHAGHQSMCCHICSGSTVSKGPKDRPKKISHWPQCHSVDTRLFCCRCATSANKNVVTRSSRCAGIHNLSFHSMAGCSRVALDPMLHLAGACNPKK